MKPAFSRAAISTDVLRQSRFRALVMDGFGRTAFVQTHQRPQSLVKKQRWTLYSKGRLATKFARCVSDCKPLKHYRCSCLCQPRATYTDDTRTSSSGILEINFFDDCSKSHQLDAWQTEDSHQKPKRHCSVLTFASSLEVKLISRIGVVISITNCYIRFTLLYLLYFVVALLCNFWVLQH